MDLPLPPTRRRRGGFPRRRAVRGGRRAAVNARVAFELAEAGATESHPLILFGENASNPHGVAAARRLAEGDVICADVSARIDGYWGDLTRCGTVGPPSDWARAAWAGPRGPGGGDRGAGGHAGARGRRRAARDRRAARGAGRACTAPATRSASRSTSRRSSSRAPRSRSPRARAHDRARHLSHGGRRDPARGRRRWSRAGGPELLSDLPLELREIPS